MSHAAVAVEGGTLAREFFDMPYYLEQAGESAAEDPFAHYLSTGAAQGLNPCPGFIQKWYEWQNPDYLETHSNGFLHYLEIGRFQGLDPSPLTDMLHFSDTAGLGMSVEEKSRLVLGSKYKAGCGLYRSFADLEHNQRQFYSHIRPVGIRIAPPRKKRRHLVFLQAGRSGLQASWLPAVTERNWDLCMNLYDAKCEIPDQAEYAIAQAGTKATAITMFAQRFGHIADSYDHILFLDDDISVTGELLNRLFELCSSLQLDAAQMALSKESNCVWPLFYYHGTSGPRYTTGVEIMMPVLSQRLFSSCSDLFGITVSGFGLDLAIGHRAQSMGDQNIAVLDQVVADHHKPIDTVGGGLYQYLRSVGINPKAELWQLVTRFGLEKSFSLRE